MSSRGVVVFGRGTTGRVRGGRGAEEDDFGEGEGGVRCVIVWGNGRL